MVLTVRKIRIVQKIQLSQKDVPHRWVVEEEEGEISAIAETQDKKLKTINITSVKNYILLKLSGLIILLHQNNPIYGLQIIMILKVDGRHNFISILCKTMKRLTQLVMLAFILTTFGCERHYYYVHHEHSPRYYRHHHRSGVDVDIHVRH
jgi:hypothetical protein